MLVDTLGKCAIRWIVHPVQEGCDAVANLDVLHIAADGHDIAFN